mmetsp:Transcript_9858/g.8404  ORF Transcript_9858/g.8404 Transcript_9858/m.8404 type:complete len:99 (+) Transcript_9858:22-318(+)
MINIQKNPANEKPKPKEGIIKRITLELNQLKESPIPDVSIGPVNEDEIYKLKAAVLGPEDTPYAGGVFFLDFDLSNDYPFKQPKMRLETKTYHPNIIG